MRPARLAALALLALLLLLPAAQACSIAHPRAARVTVTEDGLVWIRGTEIVRGEQGEEEKLADAYPFPRYVVRPDGKELWYAQGTGLGADCRVPSWNVFRWTPAGSENVTERWPQLPAAVDWERGRALVVGSGGVAELRDLATAEPIATLEPRTDRATFLQPPSVQIRGVALSATHAALATEDGVWVFALQEDGPPFRHFEGFARDRQALLAFSPDGRHLAIATVEGQRFTELRLLDLAAPEMRVTATYLDVRAALALAWREDGALGVAWQAPRHHAEEASPSAGLTLHGADLTPRGEVSWEATGMGDSLAWEDDAAIVILNGRITRVHELEPREDGLGGVPVVAPPSPRDTVPAPWPIAALALGLAFALARARRI